MTALTLLLLKTLLIFAAACLTLLALRRASSAARHLVCLLTLAALVALPCLSLALPGWQMLPAWMPPVTLSTGKEPTSPQAATEPTPPQAATLPKREGEELRTSRSGLNSSSSRFGRTPVSAANKEVGSFWPFAAIALYALGILLALLRPVLGLWGIRQLSRLSVPMTDHSVQTLTADCAAALRLWRQPQLYQAAVPVPMTWGSRRPTILLPQGAQNWPEDRLRAVLLHEMAHIRRQDWLGHRLADVTCALYWFHPLVWLTARRLRAESEAACDDLVLASGIPAPDYARHLLEIARTLPPVSTFPEAAIAMAQTSQVESRLKMILDKTQSRQALPRRAFSVALCFSIISLVGLAMLRPAARAALITSQNTGNLSVELAGVTGQPGREPRWWQADGQLLPSALSGVKNYHVDQMFEERIFKNCLVAFRLPQKARDVTTTYFVPRSVGWSSQGIWANKRRSTGMETEAGLNTSTGGYRLVTLTFPAASVKANIQVGVASGHWTTAAVEDYWMTGKQYPSSEVGQVTDRNGERFIFCPATETKDGSGTKLIIKTNNRRQDIRVIAIDNQGHAILPASVGDQSNGTVGRVQAYFLLHHSQIKEFHVETRPFRWVEFKDVALQPKQ